MFDFGPEDIVGEFSAVFDVVSAEATIGDGATGLAGFDDILLRRPNLLWNVTDGGTISALLLLGGLLIDRSDKRYAIALANCDGVNSCRWEPMAVWPLTRAIARLISALLYPKSI